MRSSPVARRARLLVSLLLCAGALGFLPRCHGAAEGEMPGYVTVSAASFEPASTCSAPDPAAPRRNGTSAVLRLTHRHGPCAPSRTSSLATLSVAETLRADQRRAEYILRGALSVPGSAFAGRTV
ncbi:uncharacterized protein LOC101781939 [Setaria italica]|uniref:uncharacterized protein LOC101781939 n=1 Tax=Setaria italica TaxID=4555 RepID=UPI000351426B|nr:uncharacterized protein LOC101781939 [Setaria italica]